MKTIIRNASLAAVAAMLVLSVWSLPARAGRHPERHAGADWPMFGHGPGRGNAPVASMGITAADLKHLARRDVHIDGTVDASAIYLHGVTIEGARHDALFVTTTYGKTLAIDADDGTVLWTFTPPSYAGVEGTYQFTTATPVADPDRRAIYAAAPDGIIRKLSVADGRVEWSTAITRLPAREKIASALNVFRGRVIAVTGGYIGDQPPYQGHVAILDARSGALLHVWNSLCSDRHELMDPRSCDSTQSAIWGRAGAVVNSDNGDIFVATGNGPWNGTTDWGDAVIELDADATHILGNYTPRNNAQLNARDEDLGSTSPVLADKSLVVQGGKDRLMRVIDWRTMHGAKPHRGGASSHVATPGGARLFTAPAVRRVDGTTWIYAADNRGTAAWTLRDRTLHPEWSNEHGGTSPVVADGMVFIYDPSGTLRVYRADSGKPLAALDCAPGHWNSPIVVDGHIILPQGNANRHRAGGVVTIWSVPRH